MTDRLQTESCESQKQIVNLNYLDREAVIYSYASYSDC